MSIVNHVQHVPKQTPHFSSEVKSLEDEILCLRTQMEQAVNQENSLTSELVVQISSKLDRKINEYMKRKVEVKENDML